MSRKTYTLKFQLNLIAITVFSLHGQFAIADSATSGSILSSVLTKAKPNQPFLLASGNVDFNNWNANWGLICAPTNGAAGCVARIPVNSGLCPTGFIPLITASMGKSLDSHIANTTSDSQQSGICISRFWAHGPGYLSSTTGMYEFSFNISQAASSGSTTGSSVAFTWSVFCIPGSYGTVPGTQWGSYSNAGGVCADATPQFCEGDAPASGVGSCAFQTGIPSPSGFAYDTKPLLWTTGFFDFSSRNDLSNVTVNTGAPCPPGYDYFYQLNRVSSAVYIPDQSSGERICIPRNNAISGTQFSAWVDQLISTVNPSGAGSNATYNWVKYCYPGPPNSNPGGAAHTLNGSCNIPNPNSTIVQQAYVIDEGGGDVDNAHSWNGMPVIDFGVMSSHYTNPSTSPHMVLFATNKTCPTGTNPSISITPMTVAWIDPQNGGTRAIESFGVCVANTSDGIPTNPGNGYPANPSALNLYHPPGWGYGYEVYIGKYSEQSAGVTNGYVSFHWQLYCFPPGAAGPGNADNPPPFC